MVDKILNSIPQTKERFKELGFKEFTKIQEASIPIILEDKDLLGIAKTGSGKTLAFLLPIIEKILQKKTELSRYQIGCLVLAPTRELAKQIEKVANDLLANSSVKTLSVFGGVQKESQVESLLEGVHILIATPGRLLDLQRDGYVDFSSLQAFILDEADMMLDMGFYGDVQDIISKLPGKRQNLMFSATMAPVIERLANDILKTPSIVGLEDKNITVSEIKQKIYTVEKANKPYLLLSILEEYEGKSVLIFCKTKFGAERIVEGIARSGHTCESFHSQKSQAKRERVLEDFKTGKISILVATDIASRGIDIKDVSLVLNYNLPEDPRNYIHRIGRTARAGNTGMAISFCVEAEVVLLKSIGKLIGEKIEVDKDQPFHKEISFAYKDSAKAKKSKKKKRRKG